MYRLSPEMLIEIGARIQKARKRQKRKSVDIATHAGIEVSYYGKIEHGKAKKISLQKIYAICRALDLEAKDIFPF